MNTRDLVISLLVHLALLAVIIIFSTGTSRAELPDLGPSVRVGLVESAPSAGPKMPALEMPSESFADAGFEPDPVVLKSKTEKEKIKKPEPKPEKKEPEKKSEPKKETTKQAEKQEPREDQKLAEAGGQTGSGLELSADGSGSNEDLYGGPLGEYYLAYNFSYVTSKISRNWNNPVKSNSEISCVIYFQITKNGDIQGVTVKKSSGISLFDRYAELAVKATDKLPPLPQDFPENEVLAINLTFRHRPQ